MSALPFSDPAGVSSSVAIALASDRFRSLANGVPRCAEDLLSLLVLAAQTEAEENPNPRVVGAKVQMYKLGFGTTLPLSDVDRLGLYLLTIWRLDQYYSRELANLIQSKGPDPRLLMRSMWTRSVALWSRVETDRAALAVRCAELEAELYPLLPEGLSLMPHQLEGVLAARDKGFGYIFADDMGLGKSMEILACALLMGERAFPMLICSPLSMVYKWTVEAKKWLAKLDPITHQLSQKSDSRILIAEARAAGRPLIMAGSWQQPVHHQMVLQRQSLGLVVGDESHYIANWESNRTQAFIRSRSRSRAVLCASGTMMPNGRHQEVYSQIKAVAPKALQFLRQPNADGDLPRGDRYPFLYRYCGPTLQYIGKQYTSGPKKGEPKPVTQFKGRSKEVEFGCLLSDHHIRRTKPEVFGEDVLPPKARFSIPVPVSDAQRMRFAKTRDDVATTVRQLVKVERDRLEGYGVRADIVDKKLKKISQTETVRRIGALRLQVGLVKAEWSKIRVKELIKEGHRPIVFAWHTAVAERAAEIYRKQGLSVLLGTGSMTGKKRDQVVQQAEAGEFDVVVLTSAYREGITLVSYDRVIMLERWWKPGDEQQAEDRIHRIGQTLPTAIEYLVIPDSYDDAIGVLQIWKELGQVQSQGTAEERLYTWLMAT